MAASGEFTDLALLFGIFGHSSAEQLRHGLFSLPDRRFCYALMYTVFEERSTRQETREVMEVTGYSRGWIQQLARRYNSDGPEVLGDGRHRNLGAERRALLDASQQRDLAEALEKPPNDGGMWNSRKVGEWIEEKSGKKESSKRQRGWEYLKKLGNSPKVPRLHHAKANEHEQEAFKKASDEGHEAQGGLLDGQGRAMVRRRAPPGLKPIVRKVWSPVGERPSVKVH